MILHEKACLSAITSVSVASFWHFLLTFLQINGSLCSISSYPYTAGGSVKLIAKKKNKQPTNKLIFQVFRRIMKYKTASAGRRNVNVRDFHVAKCWACLSTHNKIIFSCLLPISLSV